MPACSHIVLHYDEIGLKSTNRRRFEDLLIRNARQKAGEAVRSMRRECGQITVRLRGEPGDADHAVDALRRVPGIAHLSPAVCAAPTLQAMSDTAIDLLRDHSFDTFRIDTRRHDKSMSIDSMDVNRALGSDVLAAFPGRTVRLEGWDTCVKIDLNKDHAYLSVRDVPGVGGLPTDRRQKAVALLSGGLDSPVAAYLMMKRGCEVVLVHFQNANAMTDSVEDKILRLAEQLARYQVHTRLFIVPFGDLQDQIIRVVRAKRRMLVYRRVMLRIASALAEREKAHFLVTGDSLSQVASQTYDNLNAVFAGASRQILTPLIGMDKREITALSRRIETFAISSLPYEDCCSFYVPKHPELRATPALLDGLVAELALGDAEAEALDAARVSSWG